MDRHLAASLDHWLTTPPEHDDHECEEDGSCGCRCEDFKEPTQ